MRNITIRHVFCFEPFDRVPPGDDNDVLELININLTQILNRLETLNTKVDQMAADNQQILEEIENMTSVVQSVLTLIDHLVEQVANANNDPVATQTVLDSIRAKREALANAVAENTPAEPEPPRR